MVTNSERSHVWRKTKRKSLVTTGRTDEGKKFLGIRSTCGLLVTVEPKKKSSRMTQCFRRQCFGHGQAECRNGTKSRWHHWYFIGYKARYVHQIESNWKMATDHFPVRHRNNHHHHENQLDRVLVTQFQTWTTRQETHDGSRNWPRGTGIEHSTPGPLGRVFKSH